MSTYLPQETIRRKRDGLTLSPAEISLFVAGITNKTLSEGQIAAFAMAVYLQGMSLEERIALTLALRDSGAVLSWPSLPGPVVDKHSTGGVGDFVSLPLAPLLACCGCFVPMISGRGLGHTGGTLDKLSSIPGYDAVPPAAVFERVVSGVGCAIIGQTADLAPADKTLYAIRDVTATVESIDLITASILGKKLAAGLDVLVMDVKMGNGAFMKSGAQAEELADSIVRVAKGAGVRTRALITDMNAPLARSAGNAVEVAEAVRLLRGEVASERLWEVTLAIGEEALVEAGRASDQDAARAMLLDVWKSGAALEKFGDMVTALGGPGDFTTLFEGYLPVAPVIKPVFAENFNEFHREYMDPEHVPDAPEGLKEGHGLVQYVDTRDVGLAVVALGGGRTRPSDDVDLAVGFTGLKFVGETVGPETPIGVVHARSEEQAEEGAKALRAAYRIAREEAFVEDAVHKTL